jgi:hypothetical protein
LPHWDYPMMRSADRFTPGPLAYHTDHIEPRPSATSTQPSGDLRRYFREAH